MIARSTDRCAINGSIDGAAQSMDRANPSIARNTSTGTYIFIATTYKHNSWHILMNLVTYLKTTIKALC